MKLEISKIKMGDTQTRVAIDLGTVNRYAESMADGVSLPPVDIYVDEEGVHWLADGYHRVEAAESCGKTEIEATIHKGSRDDALWAALAANRTHGLPMSRDDKRNAVELALRAFSSKSNREIGRQVGCGDQLVARVRETLESNRVITQLEKTVGADGKARSAKRGKTAQQENPPANKVAVKSFAESAEDVHAKSNQAEEKTDPASTNETNTPEQVPAWCKYVVRCTAYARDNRDIERLRNYMMMSIRIDEITDLRKSKPTGRAQNTGGGGHDTP